MTDDNLITYFGKAFQKKKKINRKARKKQAQSTLKKLLLCPFERKLGVLK